MEWQLPNHVYQGTYERAYMHFFYINVRLLDLRSFFANQEDVYVSPDGAVHFNPNGMHAFTHPLLCSSVSLSLI